MRIVLDGRSLTLEQVAAAAASGARIEIAPAARERIRAARKLVDRIAQSDVPTYGINTGFGTLAEVSIARPDLQRLQRNLILSHSAGVGSPLPAQATRALMILRANVLAGGYSGIRESTLDLLLSLRRPGGTWRAGPAWWRAPGGRTTSNVEVVDWGAATHGMVTLNALRILCAAGRRTFALEPATTIVGSG